MSRCRACGRSDLHLHQNMEAVVYDREAEELSSRRRHPSGGLREERYMNEDAAFAWVLRNMPEESDKALIRFGEKNPHWRGAHWDDCLEVLFDSDGDLEVTEPLYEQHPDLRAWNHLPAAIALTLAWASIDFYTAGHDRQYEIVMEWIRKDAP